MNNIVIISGACRGIGKSIAYKLFAQGYKLCLLYNKSLDTASAMVKEFNANGDLRAIAVQCDVRSMDSCSKAVAQCTAVFGGCTHLVNNAGIAHVAPLIDITDLEWNNILDTNLGGVFHMTKCVLPLMLQQGVGNILNITSVWGLWGASCEVAYSASKSGVIGFTKALSQELGYSNIRVNAIAPGVIDTDMNAQLSKDDMQELKSATSLNRIGTAQEVANACAYLLGEESSFITGQILEVTGGFKG